MPDFLSKAACKGRCPQHLAGRHHLSRPDLIAKLLRERHVARFVVAPDGFGKSGLALEYGDTVFGFEHVFWLDGKSPCFLRDLDSGIIASTLLREDREPFLAVFEDVPPLDPDRVERLSDEMDLMLERGCEVLATCVPTCDAFDRQSDRIKLSARDLLLTDAEVDELRTPAERNDEPAAAFSPSRRAAGLVWGDLEERGGFLAGTLREELPADVLLFMFVMLALEEGSLADIAAFARCDADQRALLAENYPHLGVDLRLERFEAAPFAMADIAAAFSSKLGALAERSLFPDRDLLAVRIADALAARRHFERACDAVRLLASRPPRASWLASHGSELFDAACLVPACEAYRSLSGEAAGHAARLDADEAVRQAVLGNRAAACAAARRVAGDTSAPSAQRAAAAIVLGDCAEGDERQRANGLVATLVERGARSVARASEADPSLAGHAGAGSWVVPASVHAALEASCTEGAEEWLSWYDRGARGRFVAQAAAWVLRRAAAASRLPGEPCAGTPEAAAVERVAAIVRKNVARAGRASLSLSDAVAGISYERACERGVVTLPTFDAKTSTAVHRMEMALFAQRNMQERLEHERAERKRAFAVTHPDAFRTEGRGPGASAPMASKDPTLTVNLIGGLEVRIGTMRVDPVLFRRRKVKTLLALLVLNRGREFSRDKLVGLLWPESDLHAARKNFYGIWSMLRRALTTPAGTCPYLIRQQNGLRLDASLLATDVAQLDDVCRTLLFERPGYGGWSRVFSQINEKFSDDILPSESENEAIAGMRLDCRNRLVDALVAASSRLVAAGEVQEGLWFARAAQQRDRSREDASIALMRAQLAAGQRTAALETYFACRRYLADELGIDPSLETMRLYHSIIETEEELED